jgi:DNA mismatch repair protein MutS2
VCIQAVPIVYDGQFWRKSREFLLRNGAAGPAWILVACQNDFVSLLELVPDAVGELSGASLGWDACVEMLAGYAQSETGRRWLRALVPSTNIEWIGRQHALVEEARLLLVSGVAPAVGALFDATEVVMRARLEGSALEPDEIKAVAALAEQIAAWAAFLKQDDKGLRGAEFADGAELPVLTAAAGTVLAVDLMPLVESIRGKLLPDGSLADDASPDLRRIRREMERQQRAIEQSLQGALRRFTESGTTQESLITIRGERFVIPVKAEWKRRVPGVVHGSSSSGQTVFVEPLETIELNNDLVRLLEEEQAEIHRIYRMMTRQVGQFAEPILAGARVLAELDTVLARGRFGLEFGGIRPEFSVVSRQSSVETPLKPTDGLNGAPGWEGSSDPTSLRDVGHPAPGDFSGEELVLKSARHPVLERRLRGEGGKVVPVSVALDGAHRQMIISGPNTGGKTVTLKTVAMLAMMAQAGVPVTAEEARLPVLRAFLADIGDAQSIEQNLSTFSSHIVRLNAIAEAAGPETLVLLDEVGSATDPEEGAALAVAVAEFFLRRRAWTVISTHHTSLKIYAETTPGVVNAAVGFDERTMAPTYVLRQGVPGASAGINIAERLGLRAEMVTGARERLSTQALDIGRFLDRMHEQLAALEVERGQVQALEAEVRRERARLEVEGLKEWRGKVKELERQVEGLLKDLDHRVRETVKGLDDKATQQKLTKQAERRVAQLRREFSESFNSAVVAQHTGAARGDENATPHVVKDVAPGDVVKLRKLGQTATVQRQIDGENFEVAVGPMKMRVRRDEIAEVIRGGGAARGGDWKAQAARLKSRGVTVQMAEPDPVVSWEINVIGKTADEARDEVERFLDQAFLAGLPRIRVVHGTGMGVLRRTLREWLKRHPQVGSVTEPPYNEGGQGATVVELRY